MLQDAFPFRACLTLEQEFLTQDLNIGSHTLCYLMRNIFKIDLF